MLAADPVSPGECTAAARGAIRLTYALIDIWMDSYARTPSAITLDIDDTVDVVHGRQQLSLFNAYYDEHCFLPANDRPILAGADSGTAQMLGVGGVANGTIGSGSGGSLATWLIPALTHPVGAAVARLTIVAQLDKASPSEGKGQRFESPRVRQ